MGRLSGFEREVAKPWPRGWYKGVVVAEYETQGDKKYTFQTEDTPSLDGNSRKAQVCLTVANQNGGGKIETKSMNYSVYYNPDSLFDPERVAQVAAIKAQEPKKGRWSDTVAQRDNMSFIQLHELEQALLGEDKEFDKSEQGGLDLAPAIGQQVDVFVTLFHKVEKNGKKVTDEIPKQDIDDYFSGKTEFGKGWFYGVKYLRAPKGTE